MAERLVDVLRKGQSLLHTFPVKVGNEAEAPEQEALAKGADAAAYAGLSAEPDDGVIETRLHVDRGGSIVPSGTMLPQHAETREHLEACVREVVARLWIRCYLRRLMG